MTTSARTRKRDELRSQIDGKALLEDIADIARILHAKEAPHDKLHAVKVGALKAAADIKLRLLGKVLPDVKAVEVDKGEHWLSVSDAELDERIEQLRSQLESRTDPPSRGEGETLQ